MTTSVIRVACAAKGESLGSFSALLLTLQRWGRLSGLTPLMSLRHLLQGSTSHLSLTWQAFTERRAREISQWLSRSLEAEAKEQTRHGTESTYDSKTLNTNTVLYT